MGGFPLAFRCRNISYLEQRAGKNVNWLTGIHGGLRLVVEISEPPWKAPNGKRGLYFRVRSNENEYLCHITHEVLADEYNFGIDVLDPLEVFWLHKDEISKRVKRLISRSLNYVEGEPDITICRGQGLV